MAAEAHHEKEPVRQRHAIMTEPKAWTTATAWTPAAVWTPATAWANTRGRNLSRRPGPATCVRTRDMRLDPGCWLGRQRLAYECCLSSESDTRVLGVRAPAARRGRGGSIRTPAWTAAPAGARGRRNGDSSDVRRSTATHTRPRAVARTARPFPDIAPSASRPHAHPARSVSRSTANVDAATAAWQSPPLDHLKPRPCYHPHVRNAPIAHKNQLPVSPLAVSPSRLDNPAIHDTRSTSTELHCSRRADRPRSFASRLAWLCTRMRYSLLARA